MGVYSLLGIIVMMLTAMVVTREPEGDSDFKKAAPKKRGGGFVSRRPADP